MLDKITQVIDTCIRPLMREHGGDINVLDYQDGLLKITFTGQCRHCPSAHLTVENLVSEEIKKALPDVREVILVESVNEELLNLARQLLDRGKENGLERCI